MARHTKMVQKRKDFAMVYARQPAGQKDAKKAALLAGYSEKSVDSYASKLMADPKVRAEILRLDPTTDIYPISTHVDAQWVLSELAELWMTDIGDLFDEYDNLLPLSQMSDSARKLIAGFEVTRRFGQNGDEEIGLGSDLTKVKLLDRLKILKDIGQHIQVNAYHQEASSETDQSLARLLDAATKAIESQTPERAIDVTAESEEN